MPVSSNIAISVRGLTKAYEVPRARTERPATLAEAALARLRHPFRGQDTQTFHALSDVSFDVAKGDVVGVIGRNGAGKSTLLKVLSRITEPTAGRVDLYGRVGSLLEVGTGFHPELTGRENVYLNGAILGMAKAEIRGQFDAIVDFAGVERFLDTPVKRYSSGMYVRLAFAVAAHLRTEILIVDEVLAVGDAEFQKKCLGKMKELSRNAERTVLFVSHNIAAVGALCNRCLLLESGRLKLDADTATGVAAYVASGSGQMGELTPQDRAKVKGPVGVVSCVTRNDDGQGAGAFEAGHAITFDLGLMCREVTGGLEVTLRVENALSQPVFSTNLSDRTGTLATLHPGRCHYSVRMPGNFLAPGIYSLTIGIHRPDVEVIDLVDNGMQFAIEEVGTSMARYSGQNYGSILVDFPWVERTPLVGAAVLTG